ncbi:beta-amylase 7 isoform X1 [Senna tora]|uniref:Beta-amylase n=1 Tax=Senna tora TaxID=362788 RepID=A0A834WRH1_9FABA|nr:beta-amylase 7 isoform X1 [Senna tora]
MQKGIMATDMQKLVGTSEEDDEEMEMDVKEEDDDDEENGSNHGVASVMVDIDGGMAFANGNNRFQQHQQFQEQVSTPGGGTRRCRPLEEKERTKLRERHRRAITARILAGLRRHGNYNLRVRADINDVIAALAREAGWVVLPDGTILPSRSQAQRPAVGSSTVVTALSSQQTKPTSLKGVTSSYRSPSEYNSSRMKGVFIPAPSSYDLASGFQSQTSSMVESGGEQRDNHPLIGGPMDSVDEKQIVDVTHKIPERDFAGTPYVPVYVMLPLGVINMKCELADPEGLLKQLSALKSIHVDGVMLDCWWGIVEAHAPQEYNWNGYKKLFQMVRGLKLKLQVMMSFHECGGNFGDDVCIPTPHWVAEIGRSNPDIFFTDREGRRNPECLSWVIDKERVLRGRTAVEVYFDFMRSFRVEFGEYFEDGTITMIEVGLGPCGELRYPSCPVKHGWRYPGIGEFQCYDQYMLKSLRKAAEARGQPTWARGPDNAGTYNSQPHETGFFCDGGDYDGYYGRFFLSWYSQVLVDHGNRVLSLAKLAFEGTCIAAKGFGFSSPSALGWWPAATGSDAGGARGRNPRRRRHRVPHRKSRLREDRDSPSIASLCFLGTLFHGTSATLLLRGALDGVSGHSWWLCSCQRWPELTGGSGDLLCDALAASSGQFRRPSASVRGGSPVTVAGIGFLLLIADFLGFSRSAGYFLFWEDHKGVRDGERRKNIQAEHGARTKEQGNSTTFTKVLRIFLDDGGTRRVQWVLRRHEEDKDSKKSIAARPLTVARQVKNDGRLVCWVPRVQNQGRQDPSTQRTGVQRALGRREVGVQTEETEMVTLDVGNGGIGNKGGRKTSLTLHFVKARRKW